MGEELIYAMKERIPKGSILVGFLMDILSMGKEAVYRRLRGEVSFTFDEAVVIAREMKISLDNIAGYNSTEGIKCNLAISHDSNSLNFYDEALTRYGELFLFLKNDPTASIVTASNVIPFTFTSAYENLMRYLLCRWVYHKENIMTPAQSPYTEIPASIVSKHIEVNHLMQEMPKSYFIFDRHFFSSFVNELRYFSRIKLISEMDHDRMKDELFSLLDDIELASLTGKYSNGNEVAIYLSNINFETTYTYIQKSNFQMSILKVFSINSLETQNPRICEMQKYWIESLKRHSILISQSGEMQRITFFNEQRRLLETL